MEKTGFRSKLQILEAAAYRLLNVIFSVAVGFIISKAGYKESFSPFSLSMLSVLPASELSVTCAFIGAAAGYATKAFSVHNFRYVCADAIMLAVILISGKKRYIKNVYSPALPAAISFIIGFIFLFADEFSIYSILLLVCEAVICGCSAYFGKYLINAVARKSKLDSKDMISLNITLLIILCAFDNFYLYGFSLSLVFLILCIFMSAFFLDRKIAAAFTISFCFVSAVLHPANEHYFIVLYIPALLCILVSKFDKKYIEAAYSLAFFSLYISIYGIIGLNFQVLLTPVIVSVMFKILPKKKLGNILSTYIDISKEYSDNTNESCDALCEKFKISTDNLVKEINDTNITPLINESLENKIKKYLFLNKCRDISLVNYYSTEGKQIIALRFKCDGSPNIHTIRKMISDNAGKNFIVGSQSCDGKNYLYKFEQTDNYKIECFALYKAKRGESICGDNVSAFKSINSKYNIILADGMGSGKEAFIKSENTITLLKKLLKSGVDPSKAISTVNSSMEMLKDEIGFSTIDLCSISLENGVAQFYKCGAYYGYILRNKKLIKINGGGYPAGLTDKINYVYFSTTLEDGDYIIMMSDGVSAADDKLQAAILMSKSREPETITKELLDCAYDSTQPEYDDDMTVLTAKVTKRRFE